MRCSACAARYENPSVRCPECGALQEQTPVETAPVIESQPIATAPKPPQQRPKAFKKLKLTSSTPSLIEFPGVTRAALPPWRRELGERVRERRARETVSTTGEAASIFSEFGSTATATLELLPQTEAPEVNPLVVAALRRIERARSQSSNTALAIDDRPELELEPQAEVPAETPKPERVHNLAVVPPPESPVVETPRKTRKPVRTIGDQNDPALNYLDSIPTTVTLETRGHCSASILRRVPSAFVDLAVAATLSAPFLALTELTTLEWNNPRVVSFTAATFVIVSFLYLTVSTAFTGRTLGMRLFSLRVVDARTGLIPTGSQSAGRAIVYLLSLCTAGIVLLLTFIDREKHTLHDRFTRTVVVNA